MKDVERRRERRSIRMGFVMNRVKDVMYNKEISYKDSISYNHNVFHTIPKQIARLSQRLSTSFNESPSGSAIHTVHSQIPTAQACF